MAHHGHLSGRHHDLGKVLAGGVGVQLLPPLPLHSRLQPGVPPQVFKAGPAQTPSSDCTSLTDHSHVNIPKISVVETLGPLSHAFASTQDFQGVDGKKLALMKLHCPPEQYHKKGEESCLSGGLELSAEVIMLGFGVESRTVSPVSLAWLGSPPLVSPLPSGGRFQDQ